MGSGAHPEIIACKREFTVPSANLGWSPIRQRWSHKWTWSRNTAVFSGAGFFRLTCAPRLFHGRKTKKLNCILQLLKQHGFIVEESGCWTDLPAVQIIYQLNNSKSKDTTKKTQDCWAGRVISSPKSPAAGLLSSCCQIQNKLIIFLQWYIYCQFKHLICFLCSDVNKIWPYEVFGSCILFLLSFKTGNWGHSVKKIHLNKKGEFLLFLNLNKSKIIFRVEQLLC